MSDRQFETGAGVMRVPQVDRSVERMLPPLPAVQREQADAVPSNAMAHTAAVDRSAWSRPSSVARSFLQLQRQYGNRYVERVVARAKEDAEPNAVHPTVERQIHEQRGGGQHLDAGVRRQMEGAMGADFSGVKVHTNAKADSLNHALSARAFTTGQDIFFRQGAYQPGSFVGRELLAHELTHVVQQNGAQVSRQMTVSQPGDAHEMEAEHTAHAVMHRELHPGVGAATGISRQEEAETPAMASRCKDDAQRQPEAAHEDEEKKKHHLSKMGEGAEVARAEDEAE